MRRADFEALMQDQSIGLVVDPVASSERLVVAFGGIASMLDGVPPFEFLSALDSLSARVAFVRDLDQCWYQRGVRGVSETLEGTTAALCALVDESGCSRLVTLGTSAGGFAALYFGCRLAADAVLAFGPQTFTSHRLRWLYRDHRWGPEIANIDRLDQTAVCRDLLPVVRRSARSPHATKIEVHYGDRVRVDRVHARRLRRHSNVRLFAHDAGHNVAKVLRDQGELQAIMRRALEPTATTRLSISTPDELARRASSALDDGSE
ncbi:MAG: hypothetical protein FJW88_07090 [Actinobacteria bacterium]|nr:hypothetical protein [Actinomycetota bacterium]